jgi:endogenous inhibitor of DNA gyrase (YacG/DUF329 family)
VFVAERPCVFCRRHEAQPSWKPFCSERCKLLDLARWVDGAYRVPAEPVPRESDSGDDENNP